MKRDALPRSNEAVLQVRALGKRFTMHLRGALELPVLDGVSLDVAPGECIALTGPSGRGKSTLMKCLYGSYGIDSGHVWLHDDAGSIDLAHASAQDILALRRHTVSYVSQFLRVVPRVSALDVVAQRVVEAEPAMRDDEAYERAFARAREAARTLLARLNLPPALWDLPPATFSGGEQQRVNIARGFIVPSRLLLLDEPTASLDRANSDVVVSLIHEAKASGTAVVGIFHDPAIRDAVATRTIAFE